MPLTAAEQLMLELTNRARLDPLGEAARFGIDLNDGLAPGTISAESKQALAHNELLFISAEGHSQWMLDNDIFDHVRADGSTPSTRAADVGYTQTGILGENLSVRGTSGVPDLNAMIVVQHEDLFISEGHRENIMREGFEEVGIGQRVGAFDFPSGTFNSSMVTQVFAQSAPNLYLSGVIHTDSDDDKFYSIGEGIGGYDISTSSLSTTSASAGGYTLALAAGTTTAAVTLGAGASAMQVQVDLSAGGAKVDVVDGDEIRTSVDLTVVSGVKKATLLGVNDLDLTGSAGGETLEGNTGDNILAGEGGNDVARGGDGNDEMYGGDGNDYLHGNNDNDLLYGGAGIDQVIGGRGDDTLYGEDGADTITGGNGGDTLYGGDGDDLFFAQAGNDVVSGGDGVDNIHLGIGNDIYTGDGSGSDFVRGLAGHDTITGGTDGDVLLGHLGHDFIDGAEGNDTIRGGIGHDSLGGGDGDDLLDAAPGWDTLDGGAGNDTLIGSLGNDTMIGGSGADTFVFTARSGWDTVTDYEDGVDILSITFAGQDFDSLLIEQQDTTVTVWYGSGGIRLEDTSLSDIAADDFLFV